MTEHPSNAEEQNAENLSPVTGETDPDNAFAPSENPDVTPDSPDDADSEPDDGAATDVHTDEASG